MQRVLLTTVLAALFGAGMAIAQSAVDVAKAEPAAPRVPSYLAKFDHQFRAADKDGDGALTKQEAQAGGMGRIAEHFERLDADKDGKVTREELRALVRQGLSS